MSSFSLAVDLNICISVFILLHEKAEIIIK